MELGNQIRNYRTAGGLSQEDLAAKIYVSRQTISNWETDRTYPDVQSLLLLSALFDVTIDELVKGDVKAMKEAVDANKMKKLSYVMLAGMVLSVALIGPCFKLWGWMGLLIPLAIWAVALVSSIIVDRMKKQHDIKTFSEILAFMEGEPVDREKAERERKHHLLTKTLLVIGIGVAAGLIAFASLALFG
ncbi:helix-turn-helix transcriptional regulator [Raoultibacter phocaeensis]|uniref:helix-turn-helix transcriptional regulator n=1 Tax=Raoultibacter phocaeensis TaxID=2479841 RepID=UPI0015D5D4A0|nr:helix-turn-helix transcriptional regulator [Raoultibacter phocaeensis]